MINGQCVGVDEGHDIVWTRLTAHPRRIDQHGDVPLEVFHRQDLALRVPRAQLVEFLLAVIGNDSMGRLAESFLVTGVGTILRHETARTRAQYSARCA